MSPSPKAETLRIKDLSSAVDKAVRTVADKHKVQFEPGFTINPTIINGRILREALQDLKSVQQMANEITEQVNAAHGAVAGAHTFTPTVVWQRGHIICGFVAEKPAIFTAE